MLKLGNKTAKTNPEKAQLFAKSVERNFDIESHLFSKSQFDRILKTTVSLANTSQALGNPSQQMTIFFVSLRPSWKASIGANM